MPPVLVIQYLAAPHVIQDFSKPLLLAHLAQLIAQHVLQVLNLLVRNANKECFLVAAHALTVFQTALHVQVLQELAVLPV